MDGPLPLSSSKFNPKDSETTSKRHQLSMTFPCVFRFLTKTSTFDGFSLCFQVSDKKHKEKTSKVDVFSVSFVLNFEDEGATENPFVKQDT